MTRAHPSSGWQTDQRELSVANPEQGGYIRLILFYQKPMPNASSPFRLDFLDHIALRVKDLQASVKWYQEVLGLVPHQTPEWGDFPIFLLCGKTGLALFPARTDPKHPEDRYPDHFAFHLSPEEFRKARIYLESKAITYDYQDHHYFESIYLQDPDEHTVELTTPKRDLGDFYKPYPEKK